MLTSRRRPEAPPPPKTTSVADPLAPTTQEWREAEREKAARRKAWALRCALVVSLPLVAGGLYAIPLAYVWRVVCVRVPAARRWGVLFGVPALAALYFFPGAVLRPTRDFLLLPTEAGPLLPVTGTHALAVPGLPAELGMAFEVATADPFPPLREALMRGWATGLVWGGLLCAGCGVAALLEGPKLRARSAAEVVRAAERAVKRKPGEIERGLMLRGYITMLYAKQGTGKTEYLCWLIAGHPEVRFYFLTEQTDATLAPYLARWGLAGAKHLKIVTREAADALWRSHGHQTSATWEHLGPMTLNDAGRWGADVFIQDTWTAWTGGVQDAKGIQTAMAPIREAVGRWQFNAFVLGHTNAEGLLLGSKEFERLCDISVAGEVVEGTEVRRLTWVKDRSEANLRGQSVHLVRDLSGAFPCYRGATPEELSGGGVGGAVQEKRDSNTSSDRVRRALAGGPSTVAELMAATGLAQPTVSGALTALEAEHKALRIGKRGRAELWRIHDGAEEGDGGTVPVVASDVAV